MPWPHDLQPLFENIWQDLARSVGDRTHPFRLPAVATVNEKGDPSIRTVVLREVDLARRRLVFYTDARSSKVEEIRRHPCIAWHFWDPGRQIQLRIATSATLRQGDDPGAYERWKSCPLASRLAYLKHQSSGSEINSPEEDQLAPASSLEETEEGRTNFVVVESQLEQLDYYEILPDLHRRAKWRMGESGWVGRWVGW